ncbi:dTDP-4-dehydrorhamnose 3,5-epimerase family protein [Micromonospora sp. DT229]|uniref:dTDP-4-dehydrorhamnose 3,5-epimerase family protein n=1 Tax=Micromonospora sp. DT229 TaxID=3393430 RepID=UPI003CFA592A
MRVRGLAVEGALEFEPTVFPDARGRFVSPFQQAAFVAGAGRPLFPVMQANHSVSRRGVVRGLHFTTAPPGCAKYVYCASGRAIDIVVDVRVGSPTFGKWDSTLLDSVSFRAVYLPVGVAHAFVVLADDTAMAYMLSTEYVPEGERTLSVLDPALGLPMPAGIEPILSDRDREAPTIEQALADGMLPAYAECVALDQALRAR